jgi:hypothetical protein
MLKMRNYKLLGYIFQAVTIMLGVSFVWNHHSLIGIILFAITIFADTGLSSVRKDFTRMSVKLLLLLYGILLWFIFVTPSRVQHIKPSNGDTTLYARTRNITPRRTRAHNHPIKRSEPKLVRSGKVEKLGGETIATVQRSIQKPEAMNTLRRKISSTEVHSRSISLLAKVFGDLPTSDFADLKYRAGEEVRYQLERVFAELPQEGFLNTFKNPCWKYDMEMNENIPRTLEDLFTGEGEEETSLACLPYAYILGQPKCGTSDLFERLKVHPDIRYASHHIVTLQQQNTGLFFSLFLFSFILFLFFFFFFSFSVLYMKLHVKKKKKSRRGQFCSTPIQERNFIVLPPSYCTASNCL